MKGENTDNDVGLTTIRRNNMVKNSFIKLLSTIFLLTAVTATTTAVAKRGRSKYKYEISGKININTAPWYKLKILPGIGTKKAQAIVKYRKKHPFSKKYEIKKIKGIGKKMYVKIRNYITLTGKTDIKRKKVLRNLK